MPATKDVLAQLLSNEQAEVLVAAGGKAWSAVGSALRSLTGTEAAIATPDGRLVMPEEIAGEFGGPHFVLPLEVRTDRDQAAAAYAVADAAAVGAFFGAAEPGTEPDAAQTLVVARTLLTQLVDAAGREIFAGSPAGAVLAAGELQDGGMPDILAGLEDPALALALRLSGTTDLAVSLVLPGTFLDIVAGALPVAVPASAEPEPAPPTTATVSALPFTLTEDELNSAELVDEPVAAAGPAGLREPTPISQAPAAHRARFAPLPDPEPSISRSAIDLLADLQMNVCVELGRTELTVAEVLGLGPGSVVELDRLAGEPVDILVNDRLIARGEVVVVDENFGVRVVEVVRRGAEAEERVS